MRLASLSKPSEAIPMNGLPSTQPRSSGFSTPSRRIAHAPGRSSSGMPSTRQKSLPRPPGRAPRTASSWWRSTPATAPMSPSPDSVTTTSPASAAAPARARACSSDSVRSTRYSRSSRASAASTSGCRRAARPPPAEGLTSRAMRRIAYRRYWPYAAAPMRARLAVLALIALAGCGSNKPSKTATSERPPPGGAAVPTGCKAVPRPKARPDGRLDKAALTGRPPARATIHTNCGDITIAFDKRSPKTALSFAYLAGKDFFDGTTFWRVQRSPDGADFVIQGGDPTNAGAGGPGYTVTERPPSNTQYTRGVVAMAKTEIEKPGTSGSQFFIVTGEHAGLPPDYAVLGKVVGDDTAVKRIAAARSDPQTGRATQAAVIQKISLS